MPALANTSACVAVRPKSQCGSLATAAGASYKVEGAGNWHQVNPRASCAQWESYPASQRLGVDVGVRLHPRQQPWEGRRQGSARRKARTMLDAVRPHFSLQKCGTAPAIVTAVHVQAGEIVPTTAASPASTLPGKSRHSRPCTSLYHAVCPCGNRHCIFGHLAIRRSRGHSFRPLRTGRCTSAHQ